MIDLPGTTVKKTPKIANGLFGGIGCFQKKYEKINHNFIILTNMCEKSLFLEITHF